MRSAPVPYWLNSLLGMHLFPTILVYLAFAPAAMTLLLPAGAQPALGLWDLLGAAAALTAVTIQFFADRRLAEYRATEDYKNGGTFREGLWGLSRHPNYFGEVLFWLSMVPFAVSAGFISSSPLLVFIGPALMTAFFRFSARLTDQRSQKRRPGYRKVMREVSALVPLPQKRKPSGGK